MDRRAVIFPVLLAVLASGCASSAPSTGTATPTGSATTDATTAAAAATSPASPAGSPSPVPGFEDWSFLSADGVVISGNPAALTLVLQHRLLWFMASRGFLMYEPVSGNFRVTAHVRATKTSDPSQPAGGSGSVQLGGLMARRPVGVTENYVHIVAGDDGDGPSIETKTTTNSVSTWVGPAWPSTEADLRICRVGTRFGLYKRLAAGDKWTEAVSYVREDLPQTLEVGVDLYTNDVPDITLTVTGLAIDAIINAAACAA